MKLRCIFNILTQTSERGIACLGCANTLIGKACREFQIGGALTTLAYCEKQGKGVCSQTSCLVLKVSNWMSLQLLSIVQIFTPVAPVLCGIKATKAPNKLLLPGTRQLLEVTQKLLHCARDVHPPSSLPFPSTSQAIFLLKSQSARGCWSVNDCK